MLGELVPFLVVSTSESLVAIGKCASKRRSMAFYVPSVAKHERNVHGANTVVSRSPYLNWCSLFVLSEQCGQTMTLSVSIRALPVLWKLQNAASRCVRGRHKRCGCLSQPNWRCQLSSSRTKNLARAYCQVLRLHVASKIVANAAGLHTFATIQSTDLCITFIPGAEA